jgi:hypothetical protein
LQEPASGLPLPELLADDPLPLLDALPLLDVTPLDEAPASMGPTPTVASSPLA